MRFRTYVAALCSLLLGANQAHAVTFNVDQIEDKPDASLADGKCSSVLNPAPSASVCSLRAAVMQGNAVPEAEEVNIVLVGAAHYLLSRAGPDVTLSSAGDLDIRRPMTISAPLNGPRAAIVGAGSDGLLDISHASGTSRLFNLELAFGRTNDGTASAIQSSGNLVVVLVDVHHNRSSSGTREIVSQSNGLLTINASHFHENGAANEGVTAISVNSGSMYIEATTIDGNFGTAVNVRANSLLSLFNSTLAGNTGSAVRGFGAQVQIFSSTVVDNGSPSAAQVSLAKSANGESGFYAIGNIVGNTPGKACDVTINASAIVLDHNVLADDSCNVMGATLVDNLMQAAIALLPLGDRGGPTPTQPPLSGSAAIDFVPVEVCDATIDQRGRPRPVAAFEGGEPRCDAGAVELETQPNPDALIFLDGFESD